MTLTREKELSREEREAADRWWLTPEELDHYAIRHRPDRHPDYLAQRAWIAVVSPPLQDPRVAPLLDNKWLFANYYSALGLPVPLAHGLLHPTQGFLRDRRPLRSVSDLVAWCKRTETRDFVIKPVGGFGSNGIFVVVDTDWNGTETIFLTADERALSAADLESQLMMTFHKGTGYILQERCVLNPWFKEANLASANAVRVITFVADPGGPEMQAAVLFAGRQGQMVNDWKAGALTIAVDMSTGRLGSGRMLPQYSTEWLAHHPDTGSVFSGKTLPDWKQARELCLEAASVTPGHRVICWEVLLTQQGPRLLEGNLGFGLPMFQVHTEGFLRNGIAARWQEAGSDLPDGSGRWIRRHEGGSHRRSAKRSAKRWIVRILRSAGLEGPTKRLIRQIRRRS